jgi:hypothetical protein
MLWYIECELDRDFLWFVFIQSSNGHRASHIRERDIICMKCQVKEVKKLINSIY